MCSSDLNLFSFLAVCRAVEISSLIKSMPWLSGFEPVFFVTGSASTHIVLSNIITVKILERSSFMGHVCLLLKHQERIEYLIIL